MLNSQKGSGLPCFLNRWRPHQVTVRISFFQAAQVKMNDKGFLSRDITVQDLILNRSDVHHLFPRNYLKGKGLSRGRYNQIANYALTQSEINIAIGHKAPAVYFTELL